MRAQRKKVFGKSVESVLSQKGVSLELILVNDGSTDNTLEIMNELAGRDSRIKLVSNPQNLGVSASRNRGLQAASGQWICSVDADDWISEGRLARLVEAGREHGVSIVSDNMCFIPQGCEHRSRRLLDTRYQDI
jgi:succinoglycan biosynthesis protein ExoO